MLWHGKNFRGIINKAKQMIFDNTGTDLISTNAEDAIKEVNSNLAWETDTVVDVTYGSLSFSKMCGGALKRCKLSLSKAGSQIPSTGTMLNNVIPSGYEPSMRYILVCGAEIQGHLRTALLYNDNKIYVDAATNAGFTGMIIYS